MFQTFPIWTFEFQEHFRSFKYTPYYDTFFNKNGFISNENNAELSVFYKVLNRNPYSRFSDVLD